MVENPCPPVNAEHVLRGNYHRGRFQPAASDAILRYQSSLDKDQLPKFMGPDAGSQGLILDTVQVVEGCCRAQELARDCAPHSLVHSPAQAAETMLSRFPRSIAFPWGPDIVARIQKGFVSAEPIRTRSPTHIEGYRRPTSKRNLSTWLWPFDSRRPAKRKKTRKDLEVNQDKTCKFAKGIPTLKTRRRLLDNVLPDTKASRFFQQAAWRRVPFRRVNPG